jgi:Uma2 family endonuclease
MLDPAEIAPEKLRPLRRVEYDRLVELGVFEDERVELLHGVLVAMSPQGTRHSGTIQRLNMILVPAVVGRADVRVQSPFAASEDSEPEPDLAIVPPGDCFREHPQSALLVIEVADESLRKDRKVKARLYASCGIPEYWVVNLVDLVVEVHTHPARGQYRTLTPHRHGDEIRLVRLPDVIVPVDEFLPKR